MNFRKMIQSKYIIKYLNILILTLISSAVMLNAQTMANPNFEDPRESPGTPAFNFEDQTLVPGWSTTATDGMIEIWSDAYNGVTSFNGAQHVELNANETSTLYQDIPGISTGSTVGYEFAHRGRNGIDVMKLTITDLGADNLPGGGDDVILYQQNYSTDNTAWAFYTSSLDGVTLTALGNTVRFAYEAVSTSTGNTTEGNFIDAANFGVGVGSGDGTLPVELSSFNAIGGEEAVTLKWVTESELDNIGFEIMRASTENGDYEELSSYTYNTDLKGQVNSSQKTQYQYTDDYVQVGESYWYILVDVDIYGFRTEHGPVKATLSSESAEDKLTSDNGIPAEFFLSENYPNPFNPNTSIQFGVPANGNGDLASVRLVIYNVTGQVVRELLNQPLSAGTYRVQWNGLNSLGVAMPSGVYIYQIITAEFQQSNRMLLVK